MNGRTDTENEEKADGWVDDDGWMADGCMHEWWKEGWKARWVSG